MEPRFKRPALTERADTSGGRKRKREFWAGPSLGTLQQPKQGKSRGFRNFPGCGVAEKGSYDPKKRRLVPENSPRLHVVDHRLARWLNDGGDLTHEQLS